VPEPAPEREPESDEEHAEAELRTGILDLVGEGYGFVRVGGLARSAEDPYVSRTLVRENSLRRGDEITGRVLPRKRGERHGRMVSIEWRTHAEAPRASFDDLPVQRPTRPLRAQDGADAFALRMAELVSPLAIGQRALVAGPPGAGATHLLREIARGLIGGEERLIVALVDVRPEEVPEWDISEEVEVHSAPSDRPPREQVALAELVLERGKRLAEQGENVIVVLDSITRLARAYGLARARPGDDAPTPELLAVEGAKRWFAAARDTGAGSLTLLATVRVESESALETLVHESLLDTAGAVVRLDSELAARGLHPAIDARRSRTLGEEALVAEDRRRPLDALRGVMRSLDPVEAWEFAAARVRETASNDELLEQPGTWGAAAPDAPGQRS
jgi:transcription termination factor Rho